MFFKKNSVKIFQSVPVVIGVLLISIFIFVFISCGNRSPYPGFSKGPNGLYYKLIKISDSLSKVQYGDYITADISYTTLNDSVFFTGRRKLQLEPSIVSGSISECFVMLSESEKAEFIISADDFFKITLETELPPFIKAGSPMKVGLEILEIQTEKEYNREKEAFLNWIEDFGDYEKVILQQFLTDAKLPVEPVKAGMYRLKITEGHGKKIENGDTITINYEGRFLNGKFFDSTVRRKQPFQFVYGTEWQVIPGLEEALAMMQEGEKSLYILPSDLAFGTEGSSTGIIPPFTSLIFEVEIVKIN